MNLPIKAFAGSLAAVSVFAASAAAFAQGNGDNPDTFDRPVPTQDCLLAMTNLGDVQLQHFDEMSAQHKARMQERNAQMKEIAAITDDAEREAAMRAMHEAMNEMEPPAIPDDVQLAIDAVREACDRMGFGMHMGHSGPGMMMGFGGPGGPMMGEAHHGKGRGMMMRHRDDDGDFMRGPFGDDDSAEETED